MDKGLFTGVVMIDLRKAFDVKTAAQETAGIWLEHYLPQMVPKLPERKASKGMC